MLTPSPQDSQYDILTKILKNQVEASDSLIPPGAVGAELISSDTTGEALSALGAGTTGRAVLAAETQGAARGAVGVAHGERQAVQYRPRAARNVSADLTRNICFWGDSVTGNWPGPGAWSVAGPSPTQPGIAAFERFYMWEDERKTVDGSNGAALLAAPYNIVSGTTYGAGELHWASTARTLLGGRRRLFSGAHAGMASQFIKQVIFDNCIGLAGVQQAIHVIAIGQNSFATAGAGDPNNTSAAYGWSLVQAMISAIGHSRYLVCTVTNRFAPGTLPHLVDYNALLRANLPAANLLDIRALMMANPDGSAQDAAAVAAGDIPRSLMRDDVHLSDMGSIFYGLALGNKILENGW